MIRLLKYRRVKIRLPAQYSFSFEEASPIEGLQ